jgi:PAS domain S-box-containing protein
MGMPVANRENRLDSLGLKLNLALLAFFVVLGAATAGIILFGSHRTQNNATKTSQAGLEDFGSKTLGSFARLVSDSLSLEFQRGSQSTEMGARYLQSASANVTPTWDPAGLALNADGVSYDPTPGRLSDVWIPSFLSDTTAAESRMKAASSLDPLFPSLLESVPDAIAAYFIGADGEVRYYPPIGVQDFLTPDVHLWEEVNFDLVLPEQDPDRETVWVPPYDDLAQQGLLVSVLTPVYLNNEFYGAVGLDISLSSLVAQIDGMDPTEHGYAFYVDSAGKVLDTSTGPLVLQSLEEPGNESLAGVLSAMRSGETGYVRTQIDGADVYVAYAPLEGIGGSLALVSPIEDLLDEAKAAAITASIQDESSRTVQITLAAMGVLFVLGLIGATYLNRRVLLRPINALVSGTRAVAQGDFGVQIPVHGNDELATLGRSFNQMSVDIQREVHEREAAQEELRALFAAMTDAVVVVNKDGLYLRVPPTNAPPIVMPPDQLAGKYMRDVMPPEQAAEFMSMVEKALADQATNTVEYPLQIDDRTYWFSAAISPISQDEVVVVARDITDRINARQELEWQVQERTHELTSLLTVSRNIASNLALGPLVQTIIDQVKGIADYSRCSLFVLDGDGLVMLDSRTADSSQSPIMRVPLSDIAGIWERVGAGQVAIEGDVRHSGSPIAVAYQRGSGGLFETAYRDIHSWMGVPLEANDRVIGMLTVSHNEANFYTEHHAELVAAVATQIAVAIENARLYEQAQQLAAVEERQRLARELHDSVSQALYGIALGARTAQTLLGREPEKAAEPVDYVLSLAEAGLAEMRALIFELRPESLEIEGLVAALDKQVAATAARYGIEVTADLSEEPEMDLAQKEIFYRIGQEALHNVVKHAHATKATVRFGAENGSYVLEIGDNGVGFDTSQSFPGHMGLVSMSERAGSIGAELEVESQPGEGTAIKLRLARPQA